MTPAAKCRCLFPQGWRRRFVGLDSILLLGTSILRGTRGPPFGERLEVVTEQEEDHWSLEDGHRASQVGSLPGRTKSSKGCWTRPTDPSLPMRNTQPRLPHGMIDLSPISRVIEAWSRAIDSAGPRDTSWGVGQRVNCLWWGRWLLRESSFSDSDHRGTAQYWALGNTILIKARVGR